jgi:hypothetical protein
MLYSLIKQQYSLPQRNHVAKFGKDPIYRTKVIVRKPVWTPARPTQSHNTDGLETGVFNNIMLYSLIKQQYIQGRQVVTSQACDLS